MTSSWRFSITAALAILAFAPGALAEESGVSAGNTDSPKAGKRSVVDGAVSVLAAQMARPASDRVPLTLRHSAKCVAVFPDVMKAGLLVAGKRGTGVVSCRDEETGEWGAPAYYTITELSLGLQAGIQNASFVLLVVDDAGVERLVAEKLTLGGDASVAAGPLGAGKQANVDSSMVSYAHAEGLFAGVQLGGSSIAYAKKANARAYGLELPAKHVLFDTRTVPDELEPFQDALERYAPSRTS